MGSSAGRALQPRASAPGEPLRTVALVLTSSLALALLAVATPASADPCSGVADVDCDNPDPNVNGAFCAVWVHNVVCLGGSPPSGDCQGTVDVDCENSDATVNGAHCTVWVHRVTCL